MRYFFFSVGLLAGWLGSVAGAAPTDIQIVDAWVHETAGTQVVLHLTIRNVGVKGDRLVRVATSVAEKTVIFNQSGRQAGDLVIPGGSEWMIGTDVPRIELVGLTRSLKAPELFDLLLGFERAGKVRLTVRVVPAGVNQRAAK